MGAGQPHRAAPNVGMSWRGTGLHAALQSQRRARQGRKGAGGDECFLTLGSETEKRCHSAAPASAEAR